MKGAMMGDSWTTVEQIAELNRHYKIVKICKVYGCNDELHNKNSLNVNYRNKLIIIRKKLKIKMKPMHWTSCVCTVQ